MTMSDAVKNRINEICNERSITVNKLSTICGITQSTLGSLYNSKTKVLSITTIYIICDGLDITLSDFFDSKLFVNLDIDN